MINHHIIPPCSSGSSLLATIPNTIHLIAHHDSDSRTHPQATVTLLLAIELAAAVLCSHHDKYRSSSSLAAAPLSCIATLSIAAVAYAEHRRLLSSSALLSIYLSVTMLFDMAEARSCFIRPGLGSIGALKVATAVLKLLLLLVTEMSKRPLLRSALFQPSMGPEVTSGFWTRSLFLWLNRTLLTGFKRVMSVDDLGDLGPEFDSDRLLVQFRLRWSTGKSHPLFLFFVVLLDGGRRRHMLGWN